MSFWLEGNFHQPLAARHLQPKGAQPQTFCWPLLVVLCLYKVFSTLLPSARGVRCLVGLPWPLLGAAPPSPVPSLPPALHTLLLYP